MRTMMIAGNWKMNGSRAQVIALMDDLLAKRDQVRCDMAIFPPSVYLLVAQERLTGSSLVWGAQNVSRFPEGPYTGEISPDMLRDLGCTYTLVGHSERRHLYHESNAMVAAKFESSINAGLRPILCVGETLEQRKTGETFDHIKNQLLTILTNDLINRNSEFIIAYEPIWAIGTGETATPEIANEVHVFINETLNEIGLSDNNILIIYGGSVNSNNAYDLFNMSHISGALIGGASLDVNEFIKIYNIAEAINNE